MKIRYGKASIRHTLLFVYNKLRAYHAITLHKKLNIYRNAKMTKKIHEIHRHEKV